MKQLKALKLLEKIKQAQIDEVTPIVQRLVNEYTDISVKIDALLEQAEIEKQQLYAKGMGEDHVTFGRYYSGVLIKVEALKQQLLEIDEKLQIVRQELQEHFAAAKRYEIAANNIEQQEQAELDKKLMEQLDDISQLRRR